MWQYQGLENALEDNLGEIVLTAVRMQITSVPFLCLSYMPKVSLRSTYIGPKLVIEMRF